MAGTGGSVVVDGTWNDVYMYNGNFSACSGINGGALGVLASGSIFSAYNLQLSNCKAAQQGGAIYTDVSHTANFITKLFREKIKERQNRVVLIQYQKWSKSIEAVWKDIYVHFFGCGWGVTVSVHASFPDNTTCLRLCRKNKDRNKIHFDTTILKGYKRRWQMTERFGFQTDYFQQYFCSQ